MHPLGHSYIVVDSENGQTSTFLMVWVRSRYFSILDDLYGCRGEDNYIIHATGTGLIQQR